MLTCVVHKSLSIAALDSPPFFHAPYGTKTVARLVKSKISFPILEQIEFVLYDNLDTPEKIFMPL